LALIYGCTSAAAALRAMKMENTASTKSIERCFNASKLKKGRHLTTYQKNREINANSKDLAIRQRLTRRLFGLKSGILKKRLTVTYAARWRSKTRRRDKKRRSTT
jgi:hypothetical protein